VKFATGVAVLVKARIQAQVFGRRSVAAALDMQPNSCMMEIGSR
jgi:hypothetical protein